MSTTFHLTAHDNHKIFVRYWHVDEPKAVVQIVHGMNEHSERYHEFAYYLNQAGYCVYATDHRGHGNSALHADRIGYIGENGFEEMVNDEKVLFDYIQSTNLYLSHFILGHSMGSFITQRYIQLYGNELAGALLIGSGSHRWDMQIGATIANIYEKLTKDKRSKSLEKLVFNGYNSRFENRTGYEWLANDSVIVDEYIKDPYCAHVFPPSFFRQFLTFLNRIFQEDYISQVPVTLPLYILSGENDPVGQFGKGVERLYQQYKQIGCNDVNYKLYPGGRHEILNDFDKLEVFQDIRIWLDCHIY
ncbi:alpha/beta hydrolase [Bacillus massiliigorillae]|uniref:alpha/beta hydrolase n=1 Tax=Bacillus massiliigorillae TaxID=1243664 RepID=UPI0003A517B2|nr:alpha/beta hydrolase [Bacillus massiliigorillae]